MVMAADYPFMDVFWSMLIFFLWVIWIWIVVTVLIDVFRRRDIGGWAKAAWVIFLIVLPFLGVLVYLIAQHDGMAERRQADYDMAQAQFDERVRAAAATAPSDGSATEIEKAVKLREQGVINDAEFAQIKTKALAAQ